LKYGLVFNSKTSLIEKGVEILKNKNSKEEAQEKRKKLIEDMIDVTAFMQYVATYVTQKEGLLESIFGDE